MSILTGQAPLTVAVIVEDSTVDEHVVVNRLSDSQQLLLEGTSTNVL